MLEKMFWTKEGRTTGNRRKAGRYENGRRKGGRGADYNGCRVPGIGCRERRKPGGVKAGRRA
jgi:hypothetical protein